jgi:hypothetical protein
MDFIEPIPKRLWLSEVIALLASNTKAVRVGWTTPQERLKVEFEKVKTFSPALVVL